MSELAKGVTTDLGGGKLPSEASTDLNAQLLIPKATDQPAKPARGVTTDSGPPQLIAEVTAQAGQSPAGKEFSPGSDSGPEPQPKASLPPTRSPWTSACEPFRELIELGLARGRNAMAIWQDLVSQAALRTNSKG